MSYPLIVVSQSVGDERRFPFVEAGLDADVLSKQKHRLGCLKVYCKLRLLVGQRSLIRDAGEAEHSEEVL